MSDRTWFIIVPQEREGEVFDDLVRDGGTCRILKHLGGFEGPCALIVVQGGDGVECRIKSYRHLGLIL